MHDECGTPHFLNQLLILEPLRYHVLSDAAKEEVLDDTSDGSVRAYEDQGCRLKLGCDVAGWATADGATADYDVLHLPRALVY